MEAAVHIDRLTGYIGQRVIDKGKNRLGDILGRTPTLDGKQSVLEDKLIVLGLDLIGHTGSDDTGTDLVHTDAVFSQPVGKEGGDQVTPALEMQYSPLDTELV